jgi:hypothetical protein
MSGHAGCPLVATEAPGEVSRASFAGASAQWPRRAGDPIVKIRPTLILFLKLRVYARATSWRSTAPMGVAP